MLGLGPAHVLRQRVEVDVDRTDGLLEVVPDDVAERLKSLVGLTKMAPVRVGRGAQAHAVGHVAHDRHDVPVLGEEGERHLDDDLGPVLAQRRKLEDDPGADEGPAPTFAEPLHAFVMLLAHAFGDEHAHVPAADLVDAVSEHARGSLVPEPDAAVRVGDDDRVPDVVEQAAEAEGTRGEHRAACRPVLAVRHREGGSPYPWLGLAAFNGRRGAPSSSR